MLQDYSPHAKALGNNPYTFFLLMKDTIKTAMPAIIQRGPKTGRTVSDAVTNEEGNMLHSGHSGLHS